MTRITGDEPAHWHDENGRHRMPDPRRKPGWKQSYCDVLVGGTAYWIMPCHTVDCDQIMTDE